ncbi:MAG: hypothetical protein COW18_05880 [Zetaproteobacteria bacterium CG12_big_fil_rev_8_21_14_0_65_54_13]|nr:MAG: hypothetical protein COW18_05880 [Zetaproteobacteria bacterium CG12_big_fil_rev_8_21_14_0_65_54_13]PIX53483.1 MAG: hypothetical protein COZ50_13060 [Zetaproteobacteria bacterium CG_4_10_14_3_um_filter_54_28]PJA30910.1 MAG: hypothetical protein CO188_01295 [Zetaproteobacteria bacterium CG_4_9_14_3_um_filter_54_145]
MFKTMKKLFTKACVSIMIMIMFSLNIQMPVAEAAMVGTDQIIQQQSHGQEREKIIAFLDRAEVQQELQNQGVVLQDARARVANLSDTEVQLLSGKIDQLPAGAGGAVGVIIGAAVFIFVVLLITDILGLTNVFSFVHPIR